MHKPSFFLAVAAGVLASLALSAPTHAGSVLYSVDTDVHVTAGVATSAVVEFSAGVTGPVVVTSTTLPPVVVGTAATPTGSDVTFSFGAAGVGTYTLDFTVYGPSTGLAGQGGFVQPSGTQGGVVVLSVSSVPEPTSMALLGIGTVGFFTYRRLFKRSAV